MTKAIDFIYSHLNFTGVRDEASYLFQQRNLQVMFQMLSELVTIGTQSP